MRYIPYAVSIEQHESGEAMKKMTSRERVKATINHIEPDRVPVDVGSSPPTGIQAGALHKLRKAYKLPEKTVKVHEPFQLLGDVDDDVLKAVGADLVGLWSPHTYFGYKNDSWKDWTLSDGTKVLIGEKFRYSVDEKGNTYFYPGQSDRPSATMPAGGYYMDALLRQEPVDEDDLDGKRDFGHMFSVYSDEELRFLEEESRNLYNNTEYSIVGIFGGMALGDAGLLPGPGHERTPGIRRVEDWLMAHHLHPNYIKEVFDLQTETAVKNLKLFQQAVGNRVDIVYMSGADFGTQRSEIMSRDMFCEFYKPYFKQVNDMLHEETEWKLAYHCCGSIVKLLDDFVEMGVDVLNPVQCSAVGMDPEFLKTTYGDKLVFWGGAIDTQQTLAHGTPEQVREEALERLRIFSPGGGFIYNAIHNIQHATPAENIVAFFESAKDFNDACEGGSNNE